MKEDIINLSSADNELPLYIPMVGIAHWDRNQTVTRKCFWSCCIEYIMQGSGTVEINGRVFSPCKGDVCIFPMYSDYSCQADTNDPWVRMWIDVRGVLSNELLRLYNIENEYVLENLNLAPIFKNVFNIAANGELNATDRNLQIALYFYEIIQKIANHVRKSQSEVSDEAKRLKNYIDKNIDRNISIKELSALIYRSSSQTIRIFKKAYQCTPYDYASNLKIETAKLYLKNTSLKIKEIAYQVGFADEHYFSNVFRDKTGRTPKEFRNL